MRVASTLSWMAGDLCRREIALEVRRNVQRERIEAGIHAGIHLRIATMSRGTAK